LAEKSILDRIKDALGLSEKPQSYVRFRDNLGNFELFYPGGWKYDEDIAVIDGKYTISFQSPDGLSQFTVSVDAQLAEDFKFAEYEKAELESPESGIFATVKKTKFQEMEAYERGFNYSSGGRKFFGGGVMFYTGQSVFSVSWTSPELQKEKVMPLFLHMLKTLSVRKGFVVRKKMRGGSVILTKSKNT
jgi:hypothetical protein